MTVGILHSDDVEYLAVHVSDSPPGRGDDAATINRWHVERGFDLIGYHSVILEDGTEQLGRPEYCQGAHCPAINARSLSVCLIGEGGKFTQDQLHQLRFRLAQWSSKYPGAKVVNHRDFDSGKDCPGKAFDAPTWWESVNREFP